MRKNIKTCIYVVTAILPIVLSACSNKTDDTNALKSEKKSTTNSTTFVEDTSSDITNTTVETTTELISETKQEVSAENITEPQQTQADIQQITTITSVVNSTPMPTTTPVQTTPRPTETDQTTTPVTPEYEYPTHPTHPTYPHPTLTVKGVNKGDKYSYNGIEFTINSIEHILDSIDYDGYCAIRFNINISFTEFISPYCIYNIYNSNDDCIKTGNIKFSSPNIENDYMVSTGGFYTNRIPSDDFTIVIEFPNSQLN